MSARVRVDRAALAKAAAGSQAMSVELRFLRGRVAELEQQVERYAATDSVAREAIATLTTPKGKPRRVIPRAVRRRVRKQIEAQR